VLGGLLSVSDRKHRLGYSMKLNPETSNK
jgi:hypothetical protein